MSIGSEEAGRGKLKPLVIEDSGLVLSPVHDDPDGVLFSVSTSLPAGPFGIQDALCTNVSLEDARRLWDWLTIRLSEAERIAPAVLPAVEREMSRALTLPPLRRSAADAARFAAIVHEGQVDKAGRPYVEHLRRVAREASGELVHYAGFDPKDQAVDEAKQIAWLHDTIEDASVTADRLLDEGFHRRVVTAVSHVTKPEGCLRYADWIEHITMIGDLPTILVKLADVEDNSDPERLALLPEETRERLLRKYEPAKEVLRAAARQKGWQG